MSRRHKIEVGDLVTWVLDDDSSVEDVGLVLSIEPPEGVTNRLDRRWLVLWNDGVLCRHRARYLHLLKRRDTHRSSKAKTSDGR